MQGRRLISQEKNIEKFGLKLVTVFVLKNNFDNKRKYTKLELCQNLRGFELVEMPGKGSLDLHMPYHLHHAFYHYASPYSFKRNSTKDNQSRIKYV